MAKPKENKPMLRATIVRLPVDLLKRAKISAVKRDSSLNQLITEAIEAYLKKEGER
jgi:predicted HicB family RNase H-like nuclease